jgi:hypothetical protein
MEDEMNMMNPITATMTDEEYDREREKLREMYGDGRSIEARAKSRPTHGRTVSK